MRKRRERAHPPDPLAFLNDPAHRITLEARDYCLRVQRALDKLPPGWREATEAANRGPNEIGYGVQAQLHVALAFCGWWEQEDHWRHQDAIESGIVQNLPSFLSLQAVRDYRREVEALIRADPTRGQRGRPTHRRLAPTDLEQLKKRYRAKLEQHRRARGPARELGRIQLLKELADEIGYPSWKRLREMLFRKPARRLTAEDL